VTRSSSGWVRTQTGEWVKAEVKRTRGLNRNYNHALKAIFNGAATTVIAWAEDNPIYRHYLGVLDGVTSRTWRSGPFRGRSPPLCSRCGAQRRSTTRRDSRTKQEAAGRERSSGGGGTAPMRWSRDLIGSRKGIHSNFRSGPCGPSPPGSAMPPWRAERSNGPQSPR